MRVAGQAAPAWLAIRRQSWGTWIILFVALLNGLLYVFLVPPWQHYDEPGHFEYVWLLAHHPWPIQEADIDPTLRTAVVQSMAAHNFFAFNLNDADPSWVDVPQWVDPPLYHILASSVVRLFPQWDVTRQLYGVRLVSLVWMLVMLWAVQKITALLFTPQSHLPWLIPLSIALLPGFVDSMTAVNNDGATAACATLLTWATVSWLRQGRLLNVIRIALSACALFMTKKSGWPLLAPAFFGLILGLIIHGLHRPQWAKWVWIGMAAAAFIGIGLTFNWGDAALWLRDSQQHTLTRTEAPPIASGANRALTVAWSPGESPAPALWQQLPSQAGGNLSGQTVTLGVWMWASQPVTVDMPGIRTLSGHSVIDQVSGTIALDTQPHYVHITYQLDQRLSRVFVLLRPWANTPEKATSIYYDLPILVAGACNNDTPPQALDADATRVHWCGQDLPNLLRNSTVQSTWPVLRNGLGIQRDILSPWITYLLDRPAYSFYDRTAAPRLLRTFWATFGWGDIPLSGNKPYRVVLVIMLLSLSGLAWLPITRQTWLRDLPTRQPMVWFCGFGVFVWAIAYQSGIYFSGLIEYIVMPVARYALPGMIFSMTVLTTGWLGWARGISQLLQLRIPSGRAELWAAITFTLFLFILNCWSLISIVSAFSKT